jgi:transposase
MAIEEMAMAWRQSDAVSERVRFIAAWLSREEGVSALATRFGVSRKTAYKWIGRYAAEGTAEASPIARAVDPGA